MASRLVTLLIAALAAAALGCGASGTNETRENAGVGHDALTSAGARPRAHGEAARHGADPTGAHAPAAHAAVAATRTNDAAKTRSPFAESVPGGQATLWAVGDSAGGGHAAAVAQLIRRARPAKVLYLGDIYNGA